MNASPPAFHDIDEFLRWHDSSVCYSLRKNSSFERLLDAA